ncbi:MAG: pectate lyase [Paraglaciecola sp.]|uniref:pectate lyase n=1 Tax=Paraglaciecola sp. TaxID=1920173 RepID=UPI003299AB71
MYIFKLVFIAISIILVSCVNDNNQPKTDDFSTLSVKQFAQHYPSKNPDVAILLKKLRSLTALSKLDTNSSQQALNIISWQIENGGFGLHEIEPYEKLWDGSQPRSEWRKDGEDIANFDDGATVSELRFIAEVYRNIGNKKHKQVINKSFQKGIKFILKAQNMNGGWPQVWPAYYPEDNPRNYTNYTTLNDGAMIRNMVLLSDIIAKHPPFDTDIVKGVNSKDVLSRLKLGVNHLLNAQITSQGLLTIWPAQFDPLTYQPKAARSFELAAKTTRESVGVLSYLMNWPEKNTKVKESIDSAVQWYKKNQIKNLKLLNGDIVSAQNKVLWYRFYELDSDKPFFTGRDGIKRYQLSKIEEERRKGYGWAGNWAKPILRATQP